MVSVRGLSGKRMISKKYIFKEVIKFGNDIMAEDPVIFVSYLPLRR